MVHRGYARELDGVTDGLLAMARDHALGGKPVYVTGHSAGGALATLAARRLHAAGAPVRAAVVFSAPRVGDRRYAATYPVPLLRIEHRHDLIPHLPLPPSLAYLVGRGVVDPLLDAAEWLSPVLSGAARRPDRVRPRRRAALRRRCDDPLSGAARRLPAPVRPDPAPRGRGRPAPARAAARTRPPTARPPARAGRPRCRPG